MKIQYLAIIFLIIIIPLTLVLTIYNQSQVNNLNLQLSYNTKLSDATHDAIKAFELNTVNNKYSQVADSLKRDVEASVNVFLSSMAKSMGTSGATIESVSEYVPAILFTLYDGYYIYSPAYSEELEENTIQVESIDGTPTDIIVENSQDPKVEKFSHILKPYIYYTMRYNPGNSESTDFVVNYSLDNYITVYGKINGKYVTKSGYLLEVNSQNNNLVNISVEIKQYELLTLLKRKILSYSLSSRELDNKTLEEINDIYNNQDLAALKRYINFYEDGTYRTTLISNMGATLLDNILDGKYDGDDSKKILLSEIPISKIDEKIYEETNKVKISDNNIIDEIVDCFEVKYKDFQITDSNAKSYYIKGLQFSKWVNDNISQIEIKDAKDSKGNSIAEFEGRNDKIFNTKNEISNNPELLTSTFAQHKIEVIKNSIQSNLTSSIARYNQKVFGMKHGYDLKMPVLNDIEWKAITNKITMVTFMQGMIIGNKVYNDYSIVSSDKNKEFVDVNEIYYFNKNLSGKVYYHRYDCPELLKELEKSDSEIVGYNAIEFELYKTKNEDGDLYYEYGGDIESLRSQQFDIITDEQGNTRKVLKEGAITELSADYTCLVNANYNARMVLNDSMIFAQYTAIGRERNKHYKVNAYLDSYDIEYKKKNIILTPSITDYTNENVTVSLTSDMYQIKYYFEDLNGIKSDVEEWPMENDSFGTVVVDSNKTLYAYSDEDSNRVASLLIENIDKTAPSDILISANNVSQTSFDLIIGAKDNLSGIKRYEIIVVNKANPTDRPFKQVIDSGLDTERYTVRSRLQNTTYECYVTVYDKAGNASTSRQIDITTK